LLTLLIGRQKYHKAVSSRPITMRAHALLCSVNAHARRTSRDQTRLTNAARTTREWWCSIADNLLWQKGRLYEVEGGLSNRHTVQAVNSKG